MIAAIRSLALAALLAGIPLSAQAPPLPPQLQQRDAQMAELAIEAARRGPPAVIPLLGEGSRPMGVVYDQFLLGVLTVRARFGERLGVSETRITPDMVTSDPLWSSRGTVVVAYPVTCDGRPNHPIAIRWKTSINGPGQPTALREPMRGAEGQAVLPGVAIPDDALVAYLRNAIPIGAVVEVDYTEPVCRGAARTASLAVSVSPSSQLMTAFNGIKLPPEFASLPSPTTVRISVTLDPTGRARFPQLTQGPAELGPAAIAAITARTFPPATANGVPTPLSIMVPVVFTTDGSRAQPAPFVPPSGPMPGSGTIATSGTVMVPSSPSIGPGAPAPPAPPGQIDTMLARLAIELAAKGDPVPIPLDAAGPVVHGVLFDRFLIGVVKARAAFVAGTPLDVVAATSSLTQDGTIAVAFPLVCDGKTFSPVDLQIEVGGNRAGPLRSARPAFSGPDLEKQLPGVRLPAGAVGRGFVSANFSENLEVRITYTDPPCGLRSKTLSMPIQWVRGTSLGHVSTLKTPAGVSTPSPTTVQIRGLVDLDGAYRFPTIADGPSELTATAATTASQWKFQPYRANGVAVPQVVISALTFTETGAPPPAPPTPPGAPPPIVSNTTVGGRPVGQTTPDVPGLTAATSQCAIADDAAYGTTPAAAIKVGGDAFEGPARARRYLGALRGPAGEGLQIVRLGATMAPDRQTLLDQYEVRYAGVASPIRLMVDQYHEETLKAPKGFTCATPLTSKLF